MKRLLATILCLPLAATLVAQDLNKGYTFTPNDHVTNVKLNNLVDQASINTSFITSKAVQQPLAADSFLFYSSSGAGFRRSDFNTMFLSNTNLIFGQGEDTAPDTNAFFLELNTDTGLLAKASLNSILTNIWLIGNRLEVTNPPQPNLQFLVASNGVPYRIGESNIFTEWWRYEKFSTNPFSFSPPTNAPMMAFHTAPTNADMIRIWDAKNATNKAITLAGLVTNMPTAAVLTNADALLIFATATNSANQFGTNPVISQVSIGGLLAWLTNNPAALAVSNSLPVGLVTGLSNIVSPSTINVTNPIGQVPQMLRGVLVCQTAELGYSVLDEIDMSGIFDSTATVPLFQIGATSTNVFAIASSTTLRTRRKDTGAAANLTTANWKAKIYARWFPN